MLLDTKIICQRGRFAILAQSHEVPLRDGSIVKLHLLKEGRNPEPARLLRAFMHPDAGTFIVDLGDLVVSLQKDLRECIRRDQAGIVHHTLRLHFPNAAQLRVAIAERAIASFRPGSDPTPEQVAATARAAMTRGLMTGAAA